jgi:type I restriction enzyme, S subunit
MAGEWVRTRLGEHVAVLHGFAFKGEYFNDSGDGDVLLTPGNFEIGGGFKDTKYKYYNGPSVPNFYLSRNDLIISMTDLSKAGDTLGSPALVPDSIGPIRFLHNQRVGKIEVKSDKIEKTFLFYLLRTKEFHSHILGSSTGSTVRHTSPSRIGEFEVSIPPLHIQHRIAAILSAFDDKIELNRRMNRTLEQMARALFKSWFVDFDPVRAKMRGEEPEGMDAETAALFPDRLVEVEGREVPEGWEWTTVGRDFNLTMGQSPPGESYNEIGEGLPFYQGKTDFGFRFPTRRIYCTASTRIAKAGDVLVSVRAPVGDANIAMEESAVGRGVAAIRHSSGSTSFTYYTLLLNKPYFDSFDGEGTVFGSINKLAFEAMTTLKPNKTVLEAFQRIVGALDFQIENNENESTRLSSIRDALLPRLLAGEVDVSEWAV